MDAGSRYLVVATIGAPHGVRGEVRIRSHTENPMDFGQYGDLTDAQGRVFELRSVRIAGDTIDAVARGSIEDCLRWTETLALDPARATIAERILKEIQERLRTGWSWRKVL